MGAPPYVPAVDLEQCPSVNGEAEDAVREYWRYYFAGQALAGLVARGWLEPYPDGWPSGVACPSLPEIRTKVVQCIEDTALRAIEAADRMLARLEGEEEGSDAG